MKTANIRPFGQTRTGQEVLAVDLRADDLRATILTYGATIQDLRLSGVEWPLVLGAADIAPYEGPLVFCGAIVGPVANRISGASAIIDGTPHLFEANESRITTLHSGSTGTHARIWQIAEASEQTLTLTLDLPDGLGGFPGRRHISATFTMVDSATLDLEIRAKTDRPTLFNLANHTYWNLDGTPTIRDHRLWIDADRYTPLTATNTPTGDVHCVADTPYDFRLGKHLSEATALDHNFCVADAPRELAQMARLQGHSGIALTLSGTQPGLQVYDGRHFAPEPYRALSGRPYQPYAGLALEPQHWPDAIHHPDFPAILFGPDRSYVQRTQFRLDRSGIARPTAGMLPDAPI